MYVSSFASCSDHVSSALSFFFRFFLFNRFQACFGHHAARHMLLFCFLRACQVYTHDIILFLWCVYFIFLFPADFLSRLSLSLSLSACLVCWSCVYNVLRAFRTQYAAMALHHPIASLRLRCNYVHAWHTHSLSRRNGEIGTDEWCATHMSTGRKNGIMRRTHTMKDDTLDLSVDKISIDGEKTLHLSCP